jgi:hypothetical protein
MGFNIRIIKIEAQLTLPTQNYYDELVVPCFNFSSLINKSLTRGNFLNTYKEGKNKGLTVFNNLTETGSISNWTKIDDDKNLVTLAGFGYSSSVYSRNGSSYFENLKKMIIKHKGNLWVDGNQGISSFIHNGVEYYGTFGSYISQFKPVGSQQLEDMPKIDVSNIEVKTLSAKDLLNFQVSIVPQKGKIIPPGAKDF